MTPALIIVVSSASARRCTPFLSFTHSPSFLSSQVRELHRRDELPDVFKATNGKLRLPRMQELLLHDQRQAADEASSRRRDSRPAPRLLVLKTITFEGAWRQRYLEDHCAVSHR